MRPLGRCAAPPTHMLLPPLCDRRFCNREGERRVHRALSGPEASALAAFEVSHAKPRAGTSSTWCDSGTASAPSWARGAQSSPAWVPSQRGAFPVRLHWQRTSFCDASAVNSSGVNSVSAWEPSQKGWFLDRPQRHHQYVFPSSRSTTAGRRAAMTASLIRYPRMIREPTSPLDGSASGHSPIRRARISAGVYT